MCASSFPPPAHDTIVILAGNAANCASTVLAQEGIVGRTACGSSRFG